jgi:hypothetical protein
MLQDSKKSNNTGQKLHYNNQVKTSTNEVKTVSKIIKDTLGTLNNLTLSRK